MCERVEGCVSGRRGCERECVCVGGGGGGGRSANSANS